MRWPVFVARAQCDVKVGDNLRGSSPRRSRGSMRLSVAVAVLVVVVSVVARCRLLAVLPPSSRRQWVPPSIRLSLSRRSLDICVCHDQAHKR